MKRIFMAFLTIFIVQTAYGQVINVRDEPGGKRLLVIDGSDIRDEPGGKRLLFIDGNDIRPEPGGKRLLILNDNDVRAEPNGIRLLYLDGKNVRRSPNGKRLLFVDGKDIRDEPGGKRLLFAEQELTQIQLVTVLYQLKPDIFKLTAEEEESLKKAMNDAREESDKLFDDGCFGKFSVINSNIGDWGNGELQSTRGKGRFVYFDFKLKNATLNGIGLQLNVNGYDGVVMAAATEGAVALAVYEVGENTLKGTWIPINAAKDGQDVVGIENLKGSTKSLQGTYEISDAKAPNKGAAYKGTLTVKAKKVEGAHQLFFGESCYEMTWDIGGTKIVGSGYSFKVIDKMKEKTYLIAAVNTKGDMIIGNMLKDSATNVKGFEIYDNKNRSGYINITK